MKVELWWGDPAKPDSILVATSPELPTAAECSKWGAKEANRRCRECPPDKIPYARDPG